MKRRENPEREKMELKKILICSLLILLGTGISCSGFTIGGVVPNDQPVTAPYPAKPAPEYGKFVIYHVGEGEIKTLMDEKNSTYLINYHISELSYHPSMKAPSDDQKIYNINHPCGDGYDTQNPPKRDREQTIFYKEFQDTCGRKIRSASDHPEAIALGKRLYVYYTNYPFTYKDSAGNEILLCNCLDSGVCSKVDGGNYEFSDTPNDPNQNYSTLAGVNCYFKDVIDDRTPGYDQDWIRVPVSQFGFNKIIPLKFRLLGDQFHMRGARILKLSLYETPAGGVPDPSSEKPVANSRFGIDFSRMHDPVVGYMARPNRDYWLLISDWEGKKGLLQKYSYGFLVFVESTPMMPIPWDSTAYIYRAGIMPSRSGNPDLNNGPSFEPDDVTTRVQDIYPDCDGIPDTGDEGDWGIYEICPAEGDIGGISDPGNTMGIRDGNMQYFEVDNRGYIDDGEYFHGVKTNLPSMGYEAPSVIRMGDNIWMFISTGSGIFQLSSLDGLIGLEWSLRNIYEDRPSLLPRKDASGVSGDPKAPVVSSGRYGYCETRAEEDDEQVATRGKGSPDSVCATFGDDGYLDSYAMVDEQDSSNGTPLINSGPDGVLNTYFFPNCVSYERPVFFGDYQLKTEAPGNPDLYCGDSVTGARDETAYLLGDDQWASNAIGLNPPEYWRNQNCNPFMMAEEFNRCALGGKSNAVDIVSGNDSRLQTASDFLEGDDYFCHRGDLVGICPGKNMKFDHGGTGSILRILEKVPVNDDQLCEINPAGGLEYARFKYSNPAQLSHDDIVPGSEVVVSFYITFYRYLAGINAWPAPAGSDTLTNGTDYDINYNTGEITMLNNNWLNAIAGVGTDPAFFGDPDTKLKDVLLVYYRYQGAQVGVCPGPDNTIDTPRYFYASYIQPDNIRNGPPLELSPTMASVSWNRVDLPDLGDTYVDNITWDSGKMLFVCAGTDCPIAPGSDNSLDGAWVQDGSLSWSMNGVFFGQYSWPFNLPPAAPDRMPYIKPNRFDLYGQYDDWLCPIDGQWALCPGGNGYFQIYPLWKKVEVFRYEGIDDLLANYKKSDNPCYILENTEEQDEFFAKAEMEYIQYSYRGVMGDDRLIWNKRTNEYQISTGTNGVNQSCVSPLDYQSIPRYQGVPYQRIIVPGANGQLDSYAMKDELYFEQVENEKPLPKIRSGADGICNTLKIGDDRAEIFFGTGAPDYACVLAGDNGYANTQARGNDTQLYLPGEKTGFDAFQVDTPEIVKDGEKLYLYYSGLGWMNIPKSVPPGRGALAAIGECKRPGLDNRWGNTSYTWSTRSDSNIPRMLVYYFGQIHFSFYSALDDNQGVILAPRIGVATSTIDRIKQNPADWDRNLQPAVDVGGICQNMISGDIISIIGGLIGGGAGGGGTGDLPFPPIFNYAGSFSPEVFIKYNEADDQPIFNMFLNGIYMIKQTPGIGASPSMYNSGLYTPEYQVGMARSIDGIHFDLANDINPVIVAGELSEDLDAALGTNIFSGKDRASFLNPTIFESADDSYSMVFKTLYPIGIPGDGNVEADLSLKSKQEWLGVGFRSGSVYGGGIAGLISCKINPRQLETSQNLVKISAGALLLLPLAGLILFKILGRKTRKN